jgi:hypothetical protein
MPRPALGSTRIRLDVLLLGVLQDRRERVVAVAVLAGVDLGQEELAVEMLHHSPCGLVLALARGVDVVTAPSQGT